jgi:enoyl-CoA hydratase
MNPESKSANDAKDAEAPAEGRILTEALEHLLLITIDRPKKLNGFSPQMLRQLADAFTAFEREPAYRCGVLLANGKNFTAGVELDKVGLIMAAGRPLFPPGSIDPISLRPPIRTKPLICAVKGICFTLAIELMLAADIVVAADDCRFAQIEIKRGIMPSQGATIRMVERAGWGNAQRYLLTGDEFSAAEALRIGLVQEVVPAGTERDRATAIAHAIAEQAPLAVQASLASSRRFAEFGPIAAAAALDAEQQRLGATDDFNEGVRSFIERRKGNFRGS